MGGEIELAVVDGGITFSRTNRDRFIVDFLFDTRYIAEMGGGTAHWRKLGGRSS